jgi:protein-tyrosine phosphatase
MTRISWATHQLCVSGSLVEHDWSQLCADARVKHVVDVRIEQQDDPEHLATLGMELLLLPTHDHCSLSDDALAQGVAWVSARLCRGEHVLIHCEHGIGRSILLAACVLVEAGDAPAEALRRIKSARAIASPSPAQLDAFIRFCELRGYEGLRFDDLAAIVYAHLGPGAQTP